MKLYVKTAIRLFVIYSILLLLNGIQNTIGSFINLFNRPNTVIVFSDYISQLLPYILIWAIYVIILCFLWMKADILAAKIIGSEENVRDNTIKKNDIIEAGIILIGIFIFITTLPSFFKSITYIFLNYTFLADMSFTPNSNLRQIVEIVFQLIKLLLAYELIQNRKNIIGLLKK